MTRARWFHLVTFLVAAFAVVFQLILVLQGHHVLEEHSRPDRATRVVRFWSYLTIWGNVLVAWTACTLALGRDRDSRVWRALRLDSVVLIFTIGVVHFLFLRPLLDLHGDDLVADRLLHMVVPVVAVIGWLAFGPRGRVSAADIGPSLILPVIWLVYTLIRGEIVNWYPYPFIDVNEHGYGVVLLNCLGVAALILVLCFGAVRVDRMLAGRFSAPAG